jgi:hypothetical protein
VYLSSVGHGATFSERLFLIRTCVIHTENRPFFNHLQKPKQFKNFKFYKNHVKDHISEFLWYDFRMKIWSLPTVLPHLKKCWIATWINRAMTSFTFKLQIWFYSIILKTTVQLSLKLFSTVQKNNNKQWNKKTSMVQCCTIAFTDQFNN